MTDHRSLTELIFQVAIFITNTFKKYNITALFFLSCEKSRIKNIICTELYPLLVIY